MRIELGDVARDSITGFEGVVFARVEYLFGCVRFSLQPQALHDGKPIESQTFDEPQLVWVRRPRTAAVAPGGPEPTGGPRPEPAQRQTPPRR
jgi:hypothetical protein